MPAIELVPIPADAADDDVRRIFADAGPFVRDVVIATRAWYAREPRPFPWLGYLAGDPAAGRFVGTCSFKTAPRGGVVEIAYYTFPDFEGRGYATAMARALVRIAADEGIPRVSAQTAPQENASTRVLEKLGFVRVGEAIDDEIGRAWAWERPARRQGDEENGS